MSTLIKTTCPACGREIEIGVDTSHGVPSEAGEECQCGAIPVFHVKWEPTIWLEGFAYYERAPLAESEGKQ